MKLKVAINGFGRIGRTFFRQAFENDEIEVVAINDLGDVHNLAYLLQYDSVYRAFPEKVESHSDAIVVGGKRIRFLQEKDPGQLPWKELGVDIVIESTGVFTTQEKATAHVDAGAKRVIITAPAKDEITPTSTPKFGTDVLKTARITSNASCTTNATTPVVTIMMANPGIEKGMLSTIHGYTATQSVVDAPSKSFAKGRAAAMNIIPSSTGAAIATGRVIPDMKGKFDGIAIRVPVITGSVIDFTFLAKRDTTVEEVNEIFQTAADDPFWDGVFTVTETPLVSTDIIGSGYGSILDLSFTRVVGGNLVKILSWYDNEWGYCSMLVKHAISLKTFL